MNKQAEQLNIYEHCHLHAHCRIPHAVIMEKLDKLFEVSHKGGNIREGGILERVGVKQVILGVIRNANFH